MRRRTLLIVLAGLAVVVVAGMVVVWPVPVDRVTNENCDRIRIGMTPPEVEAILGPPGDYRTVRTMTARTDFDDVDNLAPLFDKYSALAPDGSQSRYQGDWIGNAGSIEVVFDSGVVEHKYFRRTIWREPPDNLLWRAKRQWHRWFPE